MKCTFRFIRIMGPPRGGTPLIWSIYRGMFLPPCPINRVCIVGIFVLSRVRVSNPKRVTPIPKYWPVNRLSVWGKGEKITRRGKGKCESLLTNIWDRCSAAPAVHQILTQAPIGENTDR